MYKYFVIIFNISFDNITVIIPNSEFDWFKKTTVKFIFLK